jgi:hypothetical protein
MYSNHGGKREIHTKIWSGILRERDNFGNISIDDRMILKWILLLDKLNGNVWNVLNWLRLVSNG